ncbi:methyl-accepting chemotaxis protein [uncultured Methanospirillum sp.]|uniref:methyl-accepting chemotaxis protein n=1 Tax=uncultured Methanospirillum sp. TaxID=262503 RepID=UPI0029C8849E|nr:methyl-accepting chemotaxis protein [uncultured Methanospirillum sp.]
MSHGNEHPNTGISIQEIENFTADQLKKLVLSLKAENEGQNRLSTWYKAILDAIPFPMSVTDMNMNWTFINHATENMLNVTLNEVKGKHCSNWGANICTTDQCGIELLRKGVHYSIFEQSGGHFRTDVSYISTPEGENIGHVEIVTDVTEIIKVKNYLHSEIEHTARNLEKFSRGELDLDYSVKESDEHTKDVSELFIKINDSLRHGAAALSLMSDDARMLSLAVVEGKLSTRADVSRHQGEYRRIVEGLNKTLDAVIMPLNMAAEYVDKISKGTIPPQITDTYTGDINIIKNNLNNCINAVNLLFNDVNFLSKATIEGRLDTRADATKHQGDFRKIVEGVNDTLNTLVGYIDKMPLPIMAIDTGFGILYMNDLGAGLLGTTKKELVTKKCYHQFKTSDCQTENCACAQAMKKGSLSTSETDAHPSGKDLEIAYSALPIRNQNGEVTGAFEFIQDQTASVRLNRFLNHEIGETNRCLTLLAEGNTNVLREVGDADEYTKEARVLFLAINEKVETLAESINNLVRDADKLSKAAIEGKLDIRADALKHQGDFKKVVEGVNNTLDSVIIPVHEALRVSKEYANYRFNVRVDPSLNVAGDWIEFKEVLNDIGIQVSAAVVLINRYLTDLSSNAEEAAASIEEVSAGAQQVAKNAGSVSVNAEMGNDGISQVLRAMEDLTVTVGEVSQRAEHVSTSATQANEFSKTGIDLARKSEASMVGISQSANEVDVIVQDINHQMDEIGKIVRLISDIANQTNLLALNAAIEAARAGEAGRGFAVVAAEVKSLAQDSRKSAENIADMISSLQGKAKSATIAMEKSGETVMEGSKSLTETLEAFDKIAQSIEDITRNSMDVASASEEQAASVQEITASVNEVSSLVINTSKEAGDAAAATEEASASIEQISKVVNNVSTIVETVSQEMAKFVV